MMTQEMLTTYATGKCQKCGNKLLRELAVCCGVWCSGCEKTYKLCIECREKHSTCAACGSDLMILGENYLI